MARKRIYNTNRFSGGMTDDTRNTDDLSKCARVSHLDIYRDPSQMYVMPGYVSDNSFGGNPTGLKVYNIREMVFNDIIVAVGNKADGTGSKLFSKTLATDSDWTDAFASATGTDNLYDGTYLASGTGGYYYQTTAAGVYYATRHLLSSVNDKHVTLTTFSNLYPFINVVGRNDENDNYGTRGEIGIDKVTSTFDYDSFSTNQTIYDLHRGDEQTAIIGGITRPNLAQMYIWDATTNLLPQRFNLGAGVGVAVGYPASTWVGITTDGLALQTLPRYSREANGRFVMNVKAAASGQVETLYRAYAVNNTDANILPTRAQYDDAMLWYANFAVSASERWEAVWACGKGDVNQSLAISMLFDTSSLGNVRRMYNFGTHYYFMHSNDGSISRLDNFETGTFNVPATYETLIYGADTPFLKQFEGLTVVTEDLPASATVTASYRTDEQSSWTTLGTSTGTGLRKHTFTRAAGVPIGKFQEIQFKLVFTGKIVVKNLTVSIVETDDLPYSV